MGLHIFTYGSLMFQRVWSSLVSDQYDQRDAILHGYVRKRVQSETYPAALQGETHDKIRGKVYLDVNEADIKKLDAFEGVYYQQRIVELELADNSRLAACIYVFKDEYRHLATEQDWDPDWFAKVGIESFMQQYQGFR